MSKKYALKHLSQRIVALNDKIDRLILDGKAYRKEATLHRQAILAYRRLANS